MTKSVQEQSSVEPLRTHSIAKDDLDKTGGTIGIHVDCVYWGV